MPEDSSEIEALQEELNHFKNEKEQVRNLLGQIGGQNNSKLDKVINVVFVLTIAALFAFDICRHVLVIQVSLPPLFSLELGIFMVSLKIIWMMHKQSKIDHFQFWMLNSIEFRLNKIAKNINKLKKL